MTRHLWIPLPDRPSVCVRCEARRTSAAAARPCPGRPPMEAAAEPAPPSTPPTQAELELT